MNRKVKVFRVNEEKAKGLDFKIPYEIGELNEYNGRAYIIFPDKTAVPEEWLDYMILENQKNSKTDYIGIILNFLFKIPLIRELSNYSFDIKGYLKAIFFVLLLSSTFYFLGLLEWYLCPYPSLAIYLFATFITNKK